jgi:hypothetical protein
VLSRKLVPDFIKIDVEGAELMVIEGMSEVIKEFRPVIMVEITDNYGKITDKLKSYGYALYDPVKRQCVESLSSCSNIFCFPQADLIRTWAP